MHRLKNFFIKMLLYTHKYLQYDVYTLYRRSVYTDYCRNIDSEYEIVFRLIEL